MEFMLGELRKSCDTRLPDFWSVRGENKLFIAFTNYGALDFQDGVTGLKLSETRQTHRSLKLKSTTSVRTIPVSTMEEYFPEHPQYIRDILEDSENTIADAISTLDRRANENKLAFLYSLSRVSGILAARSMKLEKMPDIAKFWRHRRRPAVSLSEPGLQGGCYIKVWTTTESS